MTDAAILLGGLAGVDPNDPATADSEGKIPANGYMQYLNADGLRGKRIGVVRTPTLQSDFLIFPDAVETVNSALALMTDLGATVVDDLDLSSSFFPVFDLWGPAPPPVLTYEFKSNIENYFASLGDDAPVKTLEETGSIQQRECRGSNSVGAESLGVILGSRWGPGFARVSASVERSPPPDRARGFRRLDGSQRVGRAGLHRIVGIVSERFRGIRASPCRPGTIAVDTPSHSSFSPVRSASPSSSRWRTHTNKPR